MKVKIQTMYNEHLSVKHYLKTLEETVRQQWTQKALCDYEGDAFTYADVATSIEQFRIFLSEAGITKRSKIAICARNCAQWAMTFWDINVNECVAVPLLADGNPPGSQGDLQDRPQESDGSLWRSGAWLHHGWCGPEACLIRWAMG